MVEIFKILCDCGHIATAKYREKDNSYSSYGIWEFSDLMCESIQVMKPLSMTLDEAILEAKPSCPNCKKSITTKSIFNLIKSTGK